MPDRKRMAIKGMTCDHCESSVARALESAGAQEVEVSYRKGEAVFRGGDGESLAKAVSEAGYRPGAIESLEPASIVRSGNGSRDYDLLVLGSGSAAFAAAIRASDLGARVALIEANTVGGTCVNVGCVPSKALLHAAELQHLASSSSIPGLRLSAAPPDLAQIVAWKDELVGMLRQKKYLDLVEAYGFELLSGKARFAGPDSVAVGDDVLSAETYLVATGASPALPPIAGLANVGYLTNETILALEKLPRRLIVIGGGPEGLEFGQAFHRLGSRVTIVQRNRYLAPQEDHDVSEAIAEILRGEGLEILTGTIPVRIDRVDDTIRLETDSGDVVEGDEILLVTGRLPNTSDLALERAGVNVTSAGAVFVDDYLRTTNPRVFAAGDVAGSPQYVYVSAYAGALAAENALNGRPRPFDLTALPRVTFTSPQIASVGLTEEQARAGGYPVKTSLLGLDMVPRAIVNNDTRGLIKLVANEQTDQLLGAHILSEHGGEVIQAAVLAIKFNLTVRDLTETFHPYLTIAEGLKLAALTFGRDVAKLSCCAA